MQVMNRVGPVGFEYHPQMGTYDQAIMRNWAARPRRILPPITSKNSKNGLFRVHSLYHLQRVLLCKR